MPQGFVISREPAIEDEHFGACLAISDFDGLIGRLDAHGYAGPYSIEMFNEDLWGHPASVAAARCYRSLLPYCSEG